MGFNFYKSFVQWDYNSGNIQITDNSVAGIQMVQYSDARSVSENVQNNLIPNMCKFELF